MAPFSGKDFNLKSVLTTIEETITKCNELSPHTASVGGSSGITDLDSYSSDRMTPCRDVINTFVHHLLTAKNNQGRVVELRKTLESSGLTQASLTGRLFTASCTKIGISPIFGPTNATSTLSLKQNYDVDYLSELIFAVGDAGDDSVRVDSMEDLREYLEAHKEIDIQSHLSGVSGPFRKYILKQLKSPFRPLLRPSERSLFSGVDSVPGIQSSGRSVVSEWSEGNMSMSQKLRYLKSKINAAEATANSVINNDADSNLPLAQKQHRTNGLNQEPVGNVSSLRQRLAAATERASMKSPETTASDERPSSALGNAAALRARLESVRRTTNYEI